MTQDRIFPREKTLSASRNAADRVRPLPAYIIAAAQSVWIAL